MDTLAKIASRLGKKQQAIAWTKRADDLLARLLTHSWRGDQFVSTRSASHKVYPTADCLLNYLPLILGQRLPKAMRSILVTGLKRFVTPHGLATEHPRSPHYLPDGYWRGPIWAPAVMLIVDGLRASRENKLADTIAARFCRTCQRSGFAENFNALTGEGLRDRAYTWTASGFLILSEP
jgi:glycogen debranching enzyme